MRHSANPNELWPVRWTRAVLHLPATARTARVDDDGREGLTTQPPACRRCGFGFMFELLDDYYPAPSTGFIVCDQEGRVLATGKGVFELTGFSEERSARPRRRRRALGRIRTRASAVRRVGRAPARQQVCAAHPRRHREEGRRATSSPPTTRTAGCCVAPHDRRARIAARRAQVGQDALLAGGRRASQTRRPCQISRCGKRAPVLARHELHQVALDLHGILLPREAEPLREPPHVRVDDDALRRRRARPRRRSPSCARRPGSRTQLVDRPRHLAVVLLEQRSASCRGAPSSSAGRSPVAKMSRSSSSTGTAR